MKLIMGYSLFSVTKFNDIAMIMSVKVNGFKNLNIKYWL